MRPRAQPDRGSEDPCSDLKTEAGCDLPGYQLYGSRRGVCPLQERGIWSERPYAVYFSKRVNEAVANGEGIESHSDIVADLDYEVELAVIIGKEAKNVPEEEVKNYIFGYTIINDVSARTFRPATSVFWKEFRRIFPNGTMYHHSGRYPISAKAFYPVPCQRGTETGQQHRTADLWY